MAYLIIFHRLIVRPLLREPGRALLTAFAVALGVAVVLAIEMAGEAAAGSFRSSLEALAGEADFEVTASGGIPPETLTSLATAPHALQLMPRIEDYGTLIESRRSVAIIGVDAIGNSAVWSNTGNSINTPQPDQLSEDQVWVGTELGLKAGDSIRLLLNDREWSFRVGGLLPNSTGDVVAMDLALATRSLRRSGTLDRILIKTPSPDKQSEWQSILQQRLPAGVKLAPYGARTDENRRMLAAFRWNLRVLSYIALVVGAFLIYNTVSVSVVRRRNEIGIVRGLGGTRGAVVLAFLGEALCFGVSGALIGILLGRILAQGAVSLIAVTVESLYVSSEPAPIALSSTVILFGLLLGTLVAVLSALPPALEAARVSPVESMARGRREHQVRLHALRNLGLSAAFATLAFFASRQPAIGGKPLFGYFAALCLIGSAAFAIPSMVSWFSNALSPFLGRLFGAEALLAGRSLRGSLRRTSVLVGALVTAIAMTAAVGIMVGSFRQTVLLWMDDRLQADLYLRPAGAMTPDRHPTLAPDTAEHLRKLPVVAAVDSFRAYDISYNGKPATLAGVEARVAAMTHNRAFVSGADPQIVFRQLATTPGTAIISEPFANKHGVRAGDTLKLQLGNTAPELHVLQVYYDYASERGVVLVDRNTLLRYLPDPAPSNIAVYLKPGTSLEDGRTSLLSALAGRKVLIFSNRTLREEAIRTFDRTFAITYALEAVAVAVAIMGVAGALLALVIDRRREFGVLRFLGAATAQVKRLVLFEAALLGLLANAGGLLLGFVLSLLLIFVINKQSFGWTIQFHWPVAVILGALTLVYAATVLAAVFPARMAARLNPIEAIHEE